MDIIEILKFHCYTLCYCIHCFIIYELVWRVYRIIQNFCNLEKKFELENLKNFGAKQWDIYHLNKKLLILCIVTWLFVLTTNAYDRVILKADLTIIMYSCVTYCILKEFQIFQSKEDIIKFIENGTGLDYGSGMAHSFFYGYLNKLLPNNGDENKGIKENIEDYEAKHQIHFPAKKLHILIPLSMHFSPSLIEHAPEGVMEACTPLETIHRNVAGVIGRSYRNSVYKIHLSVMENSSEGPLYVVAEGATPLHTLYQTVTGRVPACSESIRDHSHEIVEQFYKTLSKILGSFPEYRGTYELIKYEGHEDVAELLVQNIRTQHSRAYRY